MSRIIFFRCRISEAREATVRQGLTEKNPPLVGWQNFGRRTKFCGLFSGQPDLGLQRQQYGNDNFKEIVMGTSHRILKQRLRRAQQKQMHGASTIPINSSEL